MYGSSNSRLLYAKAVPATTWLLARLADILYKGRKEEYLPHLDHELRNNVDDTDAVLGSLLWMPSHGGYTSPVVAKRFMSMVSFSNLHTAFQISASM